MDKIYSRKRLLIPKIKKRNRRSGIRGTTFSKSNLESISAGIGGSNISEFGKNKLKNVFDRKLIKTAIIQSRSISFRKKEK